MAIKIVTYDEVIKKYVIKDIAQIYCHFNKEFELKYIIRSITYNSKTEEGFLSMVKMAKKMVGKTNNLSVINLYKDIEFLMGFYKKGAKK